jgi:hypothetical protein
MTATATKRIPTISKTSTENFYDVLSSDGFTHYPMLITGPGCVRCGCPAGEAGKQCYHRNWAVANLIYIDPEISLRLAQLEQALIEWNSKQNFIEDESELDAVRDLFGEAA